MNVKHPEHHSNSRNDLTKSHLLRTSSSDEFALTVVVENAGREIGESLGTYERSSVQLRQTEEGREGGREGCVCT